MSLLTNITIKNFKCFREPVSFPLKQGNYFIGINNAGKTAILNAINFFFDDKIYRDEGFLNRTEYLAKKGGYNRCEITISFDLNELTSSKALKTRLVKQFSGRIALVKKIIVFTPESRRFSYSYDVNGQHFESFDDLDADLQKLLKSVHVIYIHPQEGRDLLVNAQEKLKQRLLANWGRGAKLSHSIRDLQEKWNQLSSQAKTYLSASITENIQAMWPGSEVSIDLPKDVKEIVAISDITFRGAPIYPEVELNYQGTGAQSSVLYLAHYLLDSDRSLHRGEYHPVWLLEEPESFLHADLATKFGTDLNTTWLNNIQILVSTHSPLILATSRLGGEKISWHLIDKHTPQESKEVEQWLPEEISNIGKIMGDSNFSVYFSASRKENPIFIEDGKEIVKNKFIEGGISVEQGLQGVPEIARYIDVLMNSPILMEKPTYFIVDNDKGTDDIKRFLPATSLEQHKGFLKYRIKDTKNLYLILLPEGKAAEDLFSEFELHLNNCIDQIWDTKTWQFRATIPTSLTRAAARVRNKGIKSLTEAQKAIRNSQDVKDPFWARVEKDDLSIEESSINAIMRLLE